jgi:hypothetical protein
VRIWWWSKQAWLAVSVLLMDATNGTTGTTQRKQIRSIQLAIFQQFLGSKR